MRKFLVKFFILFVFGISILFSLLIYFQKPPIENLPPYAFEQYMPPPPMPLEAKKPPLYIPCLLIIFLSSAFLLLLLKYLDKNFISPLLVIEDKLKKVSTGDLDVKFKTESENEEVKNVFNILNSMVLNLKEKECLQNEFIQNLAHDLRNPVIAQERAIEILQDEFHGHELLDGLMKNSEFCLKMINIIIEAYTKRDYVINKTEFNYYKLVSALFESLKPLALSKNIELINNIPKDKIIFADYISINRITMNILSNALEHIGYNKKIKVDVNEENDKTIIIIEDNGEGIPENKINKIFEKYVSINNSGKKAISGLGLNIVYELVKKNEGSICVESEVDKYTRFVIKLPGKEKSDEKV